MIHLRLLREVLIHHKTGGGGFKWAQGMEKMGGIKKCEYEFKICGLKVKFDHRWRWSWWELLMHFHLSSDRC